MNSSGPKSKGRKDGCRVTFWFLSLTIGCSLLGILEQTSFGDPVLQNPQKQEESIEDLILELDEASTNVERKQLLAKLKKRGVMTLRAIGDLPKGLSAQTRIALEQLKFDIEQAMSQETIKASRFTLVGSFTLREALAKIESQTGNLFESKIESSATHDFNLKNIEFWNGFDQVLDQFKADIYRFSESTSLQIIPSSRSGSRSGLASYPQIARVELVGLSSNSDLTGRVKATSRMAINVSWEPRLRPMELVIDRKSIELVDDTGQTRPPLRTGPGAKSIREREASTEFDVQFEKIPRSVSSIKSIRGKLKLKTGINRSQFQFAGILGTKNKSKRIGETTVSILSATYSDSSLKVAMQFEIDNPGDSFDSHRGWMFKNKAFLVNKKLKRIIADKIMTTTQEKNKMGFVFTFANIDGPEGFDFVYETPTSIREIPLNWQIDNIKLK